MAKQQYSFTMRSGRHQMNTPRQQGFPWERLVIVALVVALGVTLWLTIPTMGYQGEVRSLYVGRMQTECDTALTYSRYLSRTASSNSNAQLAVIRSSIYGMDVLNQSYAALDQHGQRLVDEAVFTGIYSVLDSYFNKLTTGMNTSDQLTELTERLENLRTIVQGL